MFTVFVNTSSNDELYSKVKLFKRTIRPFIEQNNELTVGFNLTVTLDTFRTIYIITTQQN